VFRGLLAGLLPVGMGAGMEIAVRPRIDAEVGSSEEDLQRNLLQVCS
jgi:hypothetical protein